MTNDTSLLKCSAWFDKILSLRNHVRTTDKIISEKKSE